MKILVLLLVSIGLVSAARSGPYLPSGWKPEGPAFNLPGEVKASTQIPVEIQVEAEAEGSDAFQEYGPPKEVSQDLTKQELPEVSTEQAFVVIDLLNINENENIVEEEVTVDAQQETQDANTNIVSQVQEKEAVDVEIKDIEVQNIADALASLENEIKEIQVEVTQDAEVKEVTEVKEVAEIKEEAEVKSVLNNSEALEQAPEGFLEYGPPGFKEYGPPKYEAIRPLAAQITVPELEKIAPAIIDARRRRFSPKFRIVRRSH